MAKAKQQDLSIEKKLEQALVPEEEQPYEVPSNWVWTKLRSVSSLYNGDRGVNYPSKSDFISNGIAFINAGSLDSGCINLEKVDFISEEKYERLSAGKVTSGDILYCLRGTLGKNAMIVENIKGAIASSLCILRTSELITNKYLFFLLNSETIIKQMNVVNNGTAQPNLSAESVKNYSIPLSPLSEQQRIVDRIESLFEKLDKAKELIQDALASFENRKAAILHQAFTGELTRKWREENCVVLDSWEKTTLGELLLPMQTKKPCGGTFRYIDIDAIDNKNQIVSTPKILPVSEAPSRASRKVHTNDVLFSMVRPYLKNIAFIDESLSDCIASTGFYVCSCKEKLLSRYLYQLLCSKDTIDYLMQFMKGDNSPSIKKSDFESMPLQLPAIPEQSEIVNILDSIFENEQKEKELDDVIEKIDLMKKAILARAFRGELETNDPNDESAMELLKNIHLNSEKNIDSLKVKRTKNIKIDSEVESKLKTNIEKEIYLLLLKKGKAGIMDILTVNKNHLEVTQSLCRLEKINLIEKTNGVYSCKRG